MKSSALFAAFVALSLLPIRADAQQMTLQIDDGRVTLDAQNVPVRQILAEWARVGGAKIVNGEKVVGTPLTIQLQGMPERQALDIILRGVSGYMLAARQTGVGVSAFDRIMILPTSAAPRSTPAQAGLGNPGMNRPMPMQPAQAEPVEEVVADDGDDDTEDPEPDEENEGEGEPSSETQQQNMDRFRRRGQVFPNPLGAQMQPFVPQGGVQVFPGQPVTGQQPEGAQPPAVNTPFGIPAGASTVPGVVTPVPQAETPTPMPRRTRPPGVQ